ncbi:MAG: ParA family protein [Deltaproteobacteria bacterium]|nr:ParA family protein [Deltaproteobacteria bacterium]
MADSGGAQRAQCVAFLHQKGGTGKSTLAIASALTLAQAGRRVLLLDADYQGTSSEWGNRHGARLGVETRSQVQPIIHTEIERFKGHFDVILVDGPPSLSAMTESILRACLRVIIPVRPSAPDIWALPWLAAIIRKLMNEGLPLEPLVVFNQHTGEALSELKTEVAEWHLPVFAHPLPADPGLAGVFHGRPPPGPLAERLLELMTGSLPR